MKIQEIKKQLSYILDNIICDSIDKQQLSNRHPNFPIISKIKLSPINIELTDEQIDTLIEGGILNNISLKTDGTYDCSSVDNNATKPNNRFNITVSNIELKITKDKLEINNLNIFVSF